METFTLLLPGDGEISGSTSLCSGKCRLQRHVNRRDLAQRRDEQATTHRDHRRQDSRAQRDLSGSTSRSDHRGRYTGNPSGGRDHDCAFRRSKWKFRWAIFEEVLKGYCYVFLMVFGWVGSVLFDMWAFQSRQNSRTEMSWFEFCSRFSWRFFSRISFSILLVARWQILPRLDQSRGGLCHRLVLIVLQYPSIL